MSQGSPLAGPQPMPLNVQPQAPNAPYDPEDSRRFFDGWDRLSFAPLGSRIVPCRFLHAHHAVDLAGRYWWWDPSGDGMWGLVPNDVCLTVSADFEQWKLLAPVAAAALRKLSGGTSKDDAEAALRELYSLQKAVLAMWDNPVCILGRAWLYQTVTLTGRWAIPNLDAPVFCPSTFSLLLADTWGAQMTEDHLRQLRADPIIAQYPVVGAPIFPSAQNSSEGVRAKLALVSSK